MKRPGPTPLLVLSLSSPTVYADRPDDVAAYHRADGVLLHSITLYESHMSLLVINRNCSGSQGLGFMQINSAYLPQLARYGITRRQLLDVCVNTYVDAWILHVNIGQSDAARRAIGVYNATTPAEQFRYVNQIYTRW